MTHDHDPLEELQAAGELPAPDVSDLERWVGLPIGGLQARDPITPSDIRRFVQAFANPNPLHHDDDYAQESRFGGIVAPQSCLGSGVADTVHLQGHIPDSHPIHGGDEWWFYGPRVFPGDRMRQDRMLYDFKIITTRFAGPTVLARGDTTFVNQRGEFVAKQRAVAFRYLVSNAEILRHYRSDNDDAEPTWQDEALERLADERRSYMRSILGHLRRTWEQVEPGEALVSYVIGPHSVATFARELTAMRLGGWGSAVDWRDLPYTDDPGWIPELREPDDRDVPDPVGTDMLNVGPGRGHQIARWANRIGMPRAYGYGPSLSRQVTDYLSNWAGEWGFLRYRRLEMRRPILSGDITRLQGAVIEKIHRGPHGYGTVKISFSVSNQDDAQIGSGIADVELPLELNDDGAQPRHV